MLSFVIPLVQAFTLPRSDQSYALHLLENLFGWTHFLPGSIWRRKVIHRPDGIPMPGYAPIRTRELRHLLLPGAEVAQLSLRISENAVIPPVFVENVSKVRRVEDRKLLFLAHVPRPPSVVRL